jgi:hypothetical protein
MRARTIGRILPIGAIHISGKRPKGKSSAASIALALRQMKLDLDKFYASAAAR